jgi:hypothetical protein
MDILPDDIYKPYLYRIIVVNSFHQPAPPFIHLIKRHIRKDREFN